MKLKLLSSRCFLALLVLSTLALCGAQSLGKLTGRVTNAAGTAVSNATVKLKTGTSELQQTTTDAEGRFTFDNLPQGSYQVDVEAAGVSQTAKEPLAINSSGVTNVELAFQQSESVSASSGPGEIVIKAVAPTLQTESAEISRAYATRMVRTLPQIDRQHQELISLMPGVTPPLVSQDRVLDPQRTRIFNVNGQPDYSNAYFQDGSYQTEAYSGRPIRIAPNESVQQLSIRTSNYNAEQGFSGGAGVNTTTRPGTNGFHGSAFGLHSNRFLTTRNPLNSSTADPGFNTNQFGASLGGAIVPNKTFIFAAYEGYLRRGSILQINSIPSDNLRTGNFNAFSGLAIYDPTTGNAAGAGRSLYPGNQVPVTATNRAAIAILGYLPSANQPGLANNLIGGAPFREDQHRMDGKIDHRFSEKSTGFMRYGFTHGTVDRGSQLGPLGDAAASSLRNHNAVASLTHSLTTNLVGELRLGYSRYRNQISAGSFSPNLNADLSRLGFSQGLPQILIGGFDPIGLSGNYPSKPVNNTYDASTNWTWHNGMHNLKFGAQAMMIRADGFDGGAFSPRGSFIFGPGPTSGLLSGSTAGSQSLNSFAAFLTGAPTVAGVSQFRETPTYRQTLTSGYITDTINLWQIVHLELGVRYDVFSPPETRRSSGAAVYNSLTNQVGYSGQGNIDSMRNQKYDFNNVAPRIGIIVRPFSRMSVRAGYGIHYFPVPFSLAGFNQTANAAQTGVIGALTATPFSIPQVPVFNLSNVMGANQPYFVNSTDAQTPYVQTYNFTLQGDLGNGFLMDVGFVGALGRQLPFYRTSNASLPGSGIAGLPGAQFNRSAGTTFASTGINSNYNALQVNMTKRFGAGLSMAGAYTYSKSLDTGFDQSNPFNNRNNYGPSDFDRTHVLAVSHNWQLPFGPNSAFAKSGWAAHVLGSWELNGILRWSTGSPYTVTADSIGCNCVGLNSARANVVGNVAINGQAGFDSSLFTNTTPATFGLQGRNVFRGPDLFSYDTSLFRSFPIRENYKVELRAEAYNVTNTTNYATPVSNLASPAFGRTLRTFNGVGGRQFQVGARFLF